MYVFESRISRNGGFAFGHPASAAACGAVLRWVKSAES
jgi:hypothetical protein